MCLYTGVHLSSSAICGRSRSAYQQHWPVSRIQWPAERHLRQWFLHWWREQSMSVHTLHWCVESELSADSWNCSGTGHAAQVDIYLSVFANYLCLPRLYWFFIIFLLHWQLSTLSFTVSNTLLSCYITHILALETYALYSWSHNSLLQATWMYWYAFFFLGGTKAWTTCCSICFLEDPLITIQLWMCPETGESRNEQAHG